MRRAQVAFTRPDAIDYCAQDLAYSIILLAFSQIPSIHQGEDGLEKKIPCTGKSGVKISGQLL